MFEKNDDDKKVSLTAKFINVRDRRDLTICRRKRYMLLGRGAQGDLCKTNSPAAMHQLPQYVSVCNFNRSS